MFEDKEKAMAAKDMVRTDSNMQKMDKFLTRKKPEHDDSSKDSADGEISEEQADIQSSKNTGKQAGRQTQLSSVTQLRKTILSEGSAECSSIMSTVQPDICRLRGQAAGLCPAQHQALPSQPNQALTTPLQADHLEGLCQPLYPQTVSSSKGD